jgi:hypothetical protein
VALPEPAPAPKVFSMEDLDAAHTPEALRSAATQASALQKLWDMVETGGAIPEGSQARVAAWLVAVLQHHLSRVKVTTVCLRCMRGLPIVPAEADMDATVMWVQKALRLHIYREAMVQDCAAVLWDMVHMHTTPSRWVGIAVDLQTAQRQYPGDIVIATACVACFRQIVSLDTTPTLLASMLTTTLTVFRAFPWHKTLNRTAASTVGMLQLFKGTPMRWGDVVTVMLGTAARFSGNASVVRECISAISSGVLNATTPLCVADVAPIIFELPDRFPGDVRMAFIVVELVTNFATRCVDVEAALVLVPALLTLLDRFPDNQHLAAKIAIAFLHFTIHGVRLPRLEAVVVALCGAITRDAANAGLANTIANVFFNCTIPSVGGPNAGALNPALPVLADALARFPDEAELAENVAGVAIALTSVWARPTRADTLAAAGTMVPVLCAATERFPDNLCLCRGLLELCANIASSKGPPGTLKDVGPHVLRVLKKHDDDAGVIMNCADLVSQLVCNRGDKDELECPPWCVVPHGVSMDPFRDMSLLLHDGMNLYSEIPGIVRLCAMALGHLSQHDAIPSALFLEIIPDLHAAVQTHPRDVVLAMGCLWLCRRVARVSTYRFYATTTVPLMISILEGHWANPDVVLHCARTIRDLADHRVDVAKLQKATDALRFAMKHGLHPVNAAYVQCVAALSAIDALVKKTD